MKFKFIHKISVIQEKFLVLLCNLLYTRAGYDSIRSAARSGPRVLHPRYKSFFLFNSVSLLTTCSVVLSTHFSSDKQHFQSSSTHFPQWVRDRAFWHHLIKIEIVKVGYKETGVLTETWDVVAHWLSR